MAECERLLHSTREAAEGKAPAEAARWREVSLAARRQSEAERVSEAATAAKQEAEQALAASQLNMIRLKVIALVSGLRKLEVQACCGCLRSVCHCCKESRLQLP